MAKTQEQLEAALDANTEAIANPAGYVQFADRAVTYRPIKDLREARSLLAGELATTAGRARPKQTLIVASKGV